MSKSFRRLEIGLFVFVIVLVVAGSFAWMNRSVANYGINLGIGEKETLVENTPVSVFSQVTRHVLLSGEERVFLVLFQNNMELRPGGGFIGSFGIVKIKDKKITSFEVHDTSNFDGRIPSTVKVPYPMEEMLKIKSWKLRDSNYSVDFPTNAKKAEEFYYLGGGEEKFDGVIAVNASVLESVLEVTGPIKLNGVETDFNSKNVLIALEKQVEIDFDQQGIERGDRKKIIDDFFDAIMSNVDNLSFGKKVQLARAFIDSLNKKDIQLYFKENTIQEIVEKNKWAGKVDKEWENDYLMVSDANLGGYKSDYYMKRDIDYFVDLSSDEPVVNLKITYHHAAKEKNWMVNNYQGYLKIYAPEGSWFFGGSGNPETNFGEELNKKYFAKKIFVSVGGTDIVEFKYALPKKFKDKEYNLLVQKQSGVKNNTLNIRVKYSDGREIRKEGLTFDKDFVFSESMKKADK